MNEILVSTLGRPRRKRDALGTGRDSNPDIAPASASRACDAGSTCAAPHPEWIIKDAEAARTRTPELIAARYLGVSVGYYVLARPT